MKDFIGVFDSGLGGITVLADLQQAMPHEHLIYLGDSLHAPYGEKSQAEITELSRQIIQDFVDEGAKAILIACNTATSAAAASLRDEFDLPIIGMEPALKPAMEQTPDGKILVLATTYTLHHDKYKSLQDRLGNHDRVLAIAAPKLVRFVEDGVYQGEELQAYLSELIPNKEEISAVVLGCTHFLYLRPALNKFFGKEMTFYDGNAGTIQYLKRQVKERQRGKGSLEIRNSLSQEMVDLSQCMMNIYQKLATD